MHTTLGPCFWKSMSTVSVLAATLLLLTACASVPEAPPSSLAEARDAIASAEQSDARQYAGAELDEANRKLAMAENAMSSEKRTEADQYAQQSRVTAELAMARTSAAKAEDVNRQMRRDAEALSEELERTGGKQ